MNSQIRTLRSETPEPAGDAGPSRPAVTADAAARLAPASGSSAQADHLLSLTDEQFELCDRRRVDAELSAAPLSALFKLAHQAKAAELRTLAASLFAERYRAPVNPTSTQGTPRKKESPELRAQKRRSSRHVKKP